MGLFNPGHMNIRIFPYPNTRRLESARPYRAVVGSVELPQVQVRLSWTTFCLAYAAGAVIQPRNLRSTDRVTTAGLPRE